MRVTGFALAIGLVLSCGLSVASAAEGIDLLAGKDSPAKKGEAIAFLGDSITQGGEGVNGYIWLIEQAFAKNLPEREVRIIKAGISGHKVPDLQARLDRDVISKKPTVVFIYIGINDVWHSESGHGTPADKYESGLRDLISRIEAAGAKVVLATPSVIGEKANGTNKLDKMLDEYSDISRKVAKDTKVTLCDLHKAFGDYLAKNNPENKDRGVLTGDGVHLNQAGNKFVADQASAAIAAALKK